MNEYIKELLKDSVQGMAIAWHIIDNDEFLVWTIEIEPQMWCDELIGYYVRATAIIGHITLPTVPTLNVWDIATSKAYSAKTFDDAIVLVREFKEELAQITLPDITAQADTMVYIADLKWLNKMWQNWQDVIELTKKETNNEKTHGTVLQG